MNYQKDLVLEITHSKDQRSVIFSLIFTEKFTLSGSSNMAPLERPGYNEP